MAALRAAKKELRKAIRQRLSTVTAESITSQSNTAVQSLLSMPEYQSARRISVYLSMPSGEIATSAIVHDALQQGKKVFVPYTHRKASQSPAQPNFVMDMLSLHSEDDYRSLTPDNWGIPTFSEDSIGSRQNCLGGKDMDEMQVGGNGKDEIGLDLVVMPGMAFDKKLARLGHGKGFYDFFLQRYQEQSSAMSTTMPFLVGLALKEQLLTDNQSVPADDTDWRLDALIAGDGMVLRAH
ncbi:MAG: hypothetical protein M1830_002740 [Pleopsidium flavum]|nr:MAG: hypothetical protein M1830_002740 [Pleopsidium flavum]